MKYHFPKRLLSAALTLALLAGLLCTSAFAADFVKAEPINGTGSDGKITVTVYNQTPGDVGTGVQWTGSDPVKDVGINALRIGSVVELTTEDATAGAATQVAFGLENAMVTALKLDADMAIASNGNVSYFKPQDVQEAVEDADQATLEELAATGTNKVTGTGGVAEFTGLPYGLYLLAKSELPAEATTDFAPFLVSVPMYVNNSWDQEVYAYPKVRTDTVTLIKTANETGNDGFVNAGETIQYTLTATIPATGDGQGATKPFGSFAITDTNTDETLSIQNATANGVIVTLDDNVLTAGTDYNTPTYEDGVLTIRFTAVGLAELNKNLDQNQTITVTYNATVNTGVTSFSSQLTNSAELAYDRGSGEVKAESNDVNLYTYGIDLTKTLSDGTTITKDTISFVLYSNENCDDASKIPVVAGTNGGYWRAAAGTSTATMFVTANGSLKLYGLEPGTYYLKETATQTGYTLLDEPIKIVITAPQSPDTNNTPTATVNDANATVSGQKLVQLSVTNTRMTGPNGGFQLPQTGGEGTLLVTAIGLGLLCAAVVLLVVYRKKSRN